MEIIASIIGLLVIIGYFINIENVKKIRIKQEAIYKVLAEQNNLLSEQVNIMKDSYKKD